MEGEIVQILKSILESVQSSTFSECLDILSVGFSGIAILVAVIVPKQIAMHQNKIALFEKRYECYIAIQKMLVIAEQIQPHSRNDAICAAFKLWLGDKDTFTKNEHYSKYVILLKAEEKKFIAGQFLFSKFNSNLLLEIANEAVLLIQKCSIHNPNDREKPLSYEAQLSKDRFCKLCDQFKEKHLKCLQEELRLNSQK